MAGKSRKADGRGFAAHPHGPHGRVRRNKEQVRRITHQVRSKHGDTARDYCNVKGPGGQACYRVYHHTGEHRYRRQGRL